MESKFIGAEIIATSAHTISIILEQELLLSSANSAEVIVMNFNYEENNDNKVNALLLLPRWHVN